MLVIPMWLEIPCQTKNNDSWAAFRYSPRTKTWWYHIWNTGECNRAYGIKTDIRRPKDLLIVEEQIPQEYPDIKPRFPGGRNMSYYWCRVCGQRVNQMVSNFDLNPMLGRKPKKLPWEKNPAIQDNDGPFDIFFYGNQHPDTFAGSPVICDEFFYGNGNRHCSMTIRILSEKEVLIFGIIRDQDSLMWRGVQGALEKINYIGPIFRLKVTQWVFYNKDWIRKHIDPHSEPFQYINGGVVMPKITPVNKRDVALFTFLHL